jgi:hypothetical protein
VDVAPIHDVDVPAGEAKRRGLAHRRVVGGGLLQQASLDKSIQLEKGVEWRTENRQPKTNFGNAIRPLSQPSANLGPSSALL